MLQELSDESRQMGLKMNITKTKVMVVDNTPINVNNVLIENVPGYVSPHALSTNVQLGLSISRVVQFEVIQELSL